MEWPAPITIAVKATQKVVGLILKIDFFLIRFGRVWAKKTNPLHGYFN
jgi:hypothetical protein